MKVEGLGYTYPRMRVPLGPVFFIGKHSIHWFTVLCATLSPVAYLIECIHHLVSPVYNFQPLLTRAEVCCLLLHLNPLQYVIKQVYKTGVTHYFSIAAARRDLGYDPLPRDLSGTVKWFRERGHGRKVTYNRTWSHWLVPVLLLVLVWVLLLGALPLVN